MDAPGYSYAYLILVRRSGSAAAGRQCSRHARRHPPVGLVAGAAAAKLVIVDALRHA
jgi:hypothetical protein